MMVLSLIAITMAWAQGPNNTGTYYRDANGMAGGELKTALFTIIKDPKVVGYSGLKEAYKKTDVRPDGYLRDWYSNITNYVPGSAFGTYKAEGDAYNREHTMPQSWYSEATPMKSDIVQVLPTDGYINNMRSSNPYGEVNTSAKNFKQSAGGYSKSGDCRTPGYTGVVFEPNDEIKGDIARIYFYMMTCYEDRILSWQNGTADAVIGGTKQQPLQQWVVDMLMRWSKLDPIDDTERARNEAVYEVQQNRNPFVDYPGLEEYIWGSMQQEPFSYDHFNEVDVVFVPAPVFSIPAGIYHEPVTVSITTTAEDADIYYTLDGSRPTATSLRYEEPIVISETTTLKAIVVTAEAESSVTSATYVIRDEDIEVPVNGEFVKVTNENELKENDIIVIVNEESGNALSTEQRTNNRGVTAVTFEHDRVNVTDKVQQIVLMKAEADGWILSVDEGDLYTAAGQNRLITSKNIEESHRVTIEVNEGDATIIYPEINNRELRYNASASIFSCYTQGQKPVQIYRQYLAETPDDTEAIPVVQYENNGDETPVYNLMGMRVNTHNLRTGVYICRGKKILIR